MSSTERVRGGLQQRSRESVERFVAAEGTPLECLTRQGPGEERTAGRGDDRAGGGGRFGGEEEDRLHRSGCPIRGLSAASCARKGSAWRALARHRGLGPEASTGLRFPGVAIRGRAGGRNRPEGSSSPSRPLRERYAGLPSAARFPGRAGQERPGVGVASLTTARAAACGRPRTSRTQTTHGKGGGERLAGQEAHRHP